jgi:Na+-driven multidrug efflux pump
MRPLTVVTLIILGSCFAITFSLAAVIIVVLVLGDEYPRLQHEFEPLLRSWVLFLGMTGIAAASFYSLAKNHPARYWAQAAMWLGLFAVGWYYWP